MDLREQSAHADGPDDDAVVSAGDELVLFPSHCLKHWPAFATG